MAQLSALRNFQAPLGVAEHELYLFARHAREPLEKIVNTRSTFKVLEQRPDRDARLFEQPFTANLLGRALHGRALSPIEHGAILCAAALARKLGKPIVTFGILIRAKTHYVNPVSEPKIILVAGPTASGKSALALALAEKLGGTIINADSMQVYRDLRIITARPTPEEEARVPHRLYGHVDAAENFSVGRWCSEVADVLAAAQRQARAAIVVGGTGLYFSALTQGLAAVPPIPAQIRNAVRTRLASDGVEALHAELMRLDPAAAARLMPGDRARVTRALEVILATGRSLALWHEANMPGRVDAALAAKVFLMPDRDALLRRIDARFDAMMAAGALDEVRVLAERRLDPTLPAMKAHGVPWLIRQLNGEIGLAEAIEGGKRDTRQYTKRQATWFRNQLPDFVWVAPERALAAVEGQLLALSN
jgi:tRNA dimethylallyltransferase